MDALTGVQPTTPGTVRLEGAKNWSLWKFQVSVLLKAQGIFGVAVGTEEKPKEKSEDWVRKDAKAQSLIVTRLSEGAMIHLFTCETAADMWKKLLVVYEQKSTTSIHLLQQRFFQFQYDGSSDMSTFLAQVQELASKLKQAGEEISEKFLITKVLMSLPDKYSHLVTAWESVDSDKQNFDDLVARLLVEEERFKAKEGAGPSENVAMFVKGKFVKSQGPKCYKCGRFGHISIQCNSDKDLRKCFSCNKTGHFKLNCPKRQDIRQDIGSTKKSNAFITSALPMATGFVNLRSDKWLLDSGASEHMTCDKKLFSSLAELTSRFVVVGDGRRLPVLGIGEINIKVFDGRDYIPSKLSGVLYVPDLKFNLFSIACATNKGYVVNMTSEKCHFLKDGEIYAIGNREGIFYVLDTIVEDAVAAVHSLHESHEWFSHQNIGQLKKVLKTNRNCVTKNLQDEEREETVFLDQVYSEGEGEEGDYSETDETENFQDARQEDFAGARERIPDDHVVRTRSGKAVGEIFTEAGAAFNKLAEMTMMLHPMAEQLPMNSQPATKTTAKRKLTEERPAAPTGIPAASQVQQNVHATPISQQVTLNMLNAQESEMDVEDLSNDVKLEFESSTEEVTT